MITYNVFKMNGRNKISKAKIINFPNNWVTQFEFFERGRRLLPRFNTYSKARIFKRVFPFQKKVLYKTQQSLHTKGPAHSYINSAVDMLKLYNAI